MTGDRCLDVMAARALMYSAPCLYIGRLPIGDNVSGLAHCVEMASCQLGTCGEYGGCQDVSLFS